MNEIRFRYRVFKIFGGLLLGMCCLGLVSSVATLLIQIIFENAFPELPIWATVFIGATSVLLGYVSWRIVVAKPEELRPFTEGKL